jgi:hypothetical protein
MQNRNLLRLSRYAAADWHQSLFRNYEEPAGQAATSATSSLLDQKKSLSGKIPESKSRLVTADGELLS